MTTGTLMPWLVGVVGVLLFLLALIPLKGYRLVGIAMIPDDSIGVVTKKFAVFGHTHLPDGRVIALNEEAGKSSSLYSFLFVCAGSSI